MPEITTRRALPARTRRHPLRRAHLADEALPKLIDEVQGRRVQGRPREPSRADEAARQERREGVRDLRRVAHEEECVGLRGPEEGARRDDRGDLRLAIDLVDLGAAARTENYEIAAYEGLRRMAKALGEDEAVDLLDANLKDEKETLREVEKIATRISNESFATVSS